MDDFSALVQEFHDQADLANHDAEISHAKMRRRIEIGCGKSYRFGKAAMAHTGAEIGSRYNSVKKAVGMNAKRRGRGRPKVMKKQKTDCLSDWNVYVQEHKGTATSIRSGQHLRQLGVQWKRMAQRERVKWRSLATSRRAQRIDPKDPTTCFKVFPTRLF